MAATVTPQEEDVYLALEAFLAGVLPAGVPVIRGLPNRDAMPPARPGFVMIQALFKTRLNMPVHSWDQTGPAAPVEISIEQGLELPVQIDCYGPYSFGWSDIISTTFEDAYGFAALAPNCAPLYANEARMMPLTDEEEQYEQRWCIDAHLQYNPVVVVPQQYADALGPAILVDVNVEFPT